MTESDVDAKQAEIDRLRAGLQMIADHTIVPAAFPDIWDDLDDAQQSHISAVLIAECTLEGGDYPKPAPSRLAERLESAQCVIRQLARDTFGEELTIKEFADRMGYDS